MNYKKIVIFLTVILGAAAFCGAGIRLGKSGNTAEQKVYAAPDKGKNEESKKIAVVNLDEGVPGDGKQINYAETLSRFPSMDFEYSSLEAARTGLETGRFGAYIIIPAAFSLNVESINTTPQVSQLEYAVNRSYSGNMQYELLCNIWTYVDSLNYHLTYMYVDSILRELHDAQDGAKRVMENDLKDVETLERIQSHDLVTLAEIPKIPIEETMPEALDISEYMEQSSALVEHVNAEYEQCVQDIRTKIESVSDGGTALSEHLTSLAGTTAELDLTVDENGESIVERAEGRLHAELERQAEHFLDQEMISEYLKNLKNTNEEFLKMYLDQDMNQSETQEEQNENQPGFIDGENENQSEAQDQLIFMLRSQIQVLDFLLEEAGKAENLDIGKITQLVQTEYAEPIVSNAEEVKKLFQQRNAEELKAIKIYNGQLAEFQPQMDYLFLTRNIQDLRENQRSMQAALLENNQAYMDYVQKSSAVTKAYREDLQKYTAKAMEERFRAVKETKEKSSAVNQRILGDFSSKLAYTRLGSAEYTRVYQFIANPLCVEDRSVNKTMEDFIGRRKNDYEY